MSPSELIAQWHFRNHRVQLCHYESARQFQRLHLWLGLPAIALSAIVGTAVFAGLSKEASVEIRILTGLLSVTAAALTGLQTFLKYSELAEKHRLAGARFANLTHRIEMLASFPLATEQETLDALTAIEQSWGKLREESPMLPARLWRHFEKTMLFEQEKGP